MFSGVRVHSYAKVKDAIVLPDVDIGRGAVIQNAIIDRGAHSPPGAQIGVDPETDMENQYHRTEKGRVLVTPDMLRQKVHEQ